MSLECETSFEHPPPPQGEQILKIRHIGVLGSLAHRITLTGILGSGSLRVYEKSGLGMFLQLAERKRSQEAWSTPWHHSHNK